MVRLKVEFGSDYRGAWNVRLKAGKYSQYRILPAVVTIYQVTPAFLQVCYGRIVRVVSIPTQFLPPPPPPAPPPLLPFSRSLSHRPDNTAGPGRWFGQAAVMVNFKLARLNCDLKQCSKCCVV